MSSEKHIRIQGFYKILSTMSMTKFKLLTDEKTGKCNLFSKGTETNVTEMTYRNEHIKILKQLL